MLLLHAALPIPHRVLCRTATAPSMLILSVARSATAAAGSSAAQYDAARSPELGARCSLGGRGNRKGIDNRLAKLRSQSIEANFRLVQYFSNSSSEVNYVEKCLMKLLYSRGADEV